MGDPEGCYYLGCLLCHHKSPPDAAGARAAWERAAVDGHYPRAMQRLGAWFEEAKPPDMESANHWYEQARHRWALYVSLGFVGEGESLE